SVLDSYVNAAQYIALGRLLFHVGRSEGPGEVPFSGPSLMPLVRAVLVLGSRANAHSSPISIITTFFNRIWDLIAAMIKLQPTLFSLDSPDSLFGELKELLEAMVAVSVKRADEGEDYAFHIPLVVSVFTLYYGLDDRKRVISELCDTVYKLMCEGDLIAMSDRPSLFNIPKMNTFGIWYKKITGFEIIDERSRAEKELRRKIELPFIEKHLTYNPYPQPRTSLINSARKLKAWRHRFYISRPYGSFPLVTLPAYDTTHPSLPPPRDLVEFWGDLSYPDKIYKDWYEYPVGNLKTVCDTFFDKFIEAAKIDRGSEKCCEEKECKDECEKEEDCCCSRPDSKPCSLCERIILLLTSCVISLQLTKHNRRTVLEIPDHVLNTVTNFCGRKTFSAIYPIFSSNEKYLEERNKRVLFTNANQKKLFVFQQLNSLQQPPVAMPLECINKKKIPPAVRYTSSNADKVVTKVVKARVPVVNDLKFRNTRKLVTLDEGTYAFDAFTLTSCRAGHLGKKISEVLTQGNSCAHTSTIMTCSALPSLFFKDRAEIVAHVCKVLSNVFKEGVNAGDNVSRLNELGVIIHKLGFIALTRSEGVSLWESLRPFWRKKSVRNAINTRFLQTILIFLGSLLYLDSQYIFDLFELMNSVESEKQRAIIAASILRVTPSLRARTEEEVKVWGDRLVCVLEGRTYEPDEDDEEEEEEEIAKSISKSVISKKDNKAMRVIVGKTVFNLISKLTDEFGRIANPNSD
ncbi:hypothetical protein ADUPG1_010829, partial [Aduncisulcus paluster]